METHKGKTCGWKRELRLSNISKSHGANVLLRQYFTSIKGTNFMIDQSFWNALVRYMWLSVFVDVSHCQIKKVFYYNPSWLSLMGKL